MKKINDTELLEMLSQGKKQKEIAEHFQVSPVAVCKRIRRLLPQPDIDKFGLTDNQKAFVIEKVKGKTNTQAAVASYDTTSLQSAKAIGSQLMDNPKIQVAINELMEHHGLTRSYRIQKLKKHVDHPDPNISLRSINLANKMDSTYSSANISSLPSFLQIKIEIPRKNCVIAPSPEDQDAVIEVKPEAD